MNDITVRLSRENIYREKLEELSHEMNHIKAIHGLTDEDRERYRIENLHLYFDFLNSSYPAARMLVLLFYVIGFSLLAIPSMDVFVRVLGVLICKIG